ncbi:hypothetical protein [Neobacillus mesonae]|uniref:hypothetical protein n=1 Tax=Neobacillus mesonae TaxID=1193713 RepID=UPI00203BA9C4|nr:hypothetical protein [Neobacillus mesonae]MCM3567289.1 hypothetical protein [Neobacillus mesonae]
MTPETLEIIRGLIVYYLCIQVIYSVLIMIFGQMILNIYEAGYYENPRNLFEKVLTFIVNFFFGAGAFIAKKVKKYSWAKRKLLMLMANIILFIASVIIYYILKFILEAIFL